MESRDTVWTKIFQICVLSAFVLLLFLLHRRSRLSQVPGPFLACFTDLWRIYHQNYYNFTSVLAELHRRYGYVVRIGPNTVSVSDAGAVSTVYDSQGAFIKADSYHPLRGAVNGEIRGSIIDLQDENAVSQIKRAIGHVFSEKNVLDYEGDVDEVCDKLIDVMRRDQPFDLFATLGRFQADFLSQIAFGERPQHLQHGTDSSYLSSENRFKHWMRWQGAPFLERMVYKTPILLRFFKSRAPPRWAQMADHKLKARLSSDSSVNPDTQKMDLLDKYIAGGEKRGDKLPVEAIPRVVTSTTSAGFDTTAFTMTAVLYYLRKTPEAATKLCEELRAASLSAPPQFRETQHLKYLGAVIKEAMRLYPFLQLLLERTVPAGGCTISGQYLPHCTVVGCHASIVHTDSTFYGPDSNEFRPERWLIEDKSQLLAMERAQLGFGNGKRICLGRHLAELEMKKVISRIIMAFDIDFVDPNCVLAPNDNLTSFPKPLWVTCKARPTFP